MADRLDPRFVHLLPTPVLPGKPIEMRFSVPLDASQRQEAADLIRAHISHRKTRVSISSETIRIEGLFVRESRPLRQALARFRAAVCPKPIRLRER
jgi:hypothetical protein